MGDSEQWYSNKELYEQLNNFKEDFVALRTEMRETRTIIKQYNGLRGKIEGVETVVLNLKAKAEERSSILKAVRQWGGWLFAFITLIVLLYKTF